MSERPIWYENKLKRDAEYLKENTKQFIVRINKNTDGDMIEHLEKQPNKQGYIKDLIRVDMAKK